jgi:hypothetical protein
MWTWATGMPLRVPGGQGPSDDVAGEGIHEGRLKAPLDDRRF